MKKYCFITDEETGLVQLGAGCPDEYYIEIGMKERNVKQSDIDYQWYLEELCPMKTEEQKEQERREMINNLTCTKRVLVLMLEELGLDYYENILPLIEMNRNAKLEWDLCVELLRSNPMIDLIASKLDITPEQIDRLFLYANGKVDTLKEVSNG